MLLALHVMWRRRNASNSSLSETYVRS